MIFSASVVVAIVTIVGAIIGLESTTRSAERASLGLASRIDRVDSLAQDVDRVVVATRDYLWGTTSRREFRDAVVELEGKLVRARTDDPAIAQADRDFAGYLDAVEHEAPTRDPDIVATYVTHDLAPKQAKLLNDIDLYASHARERFAGDMQRLRRFAEVMELALLLCAAAGLGLEIARWFWIPAINARSRSNMTTADAQLLDELLDAMRIQNGDAGLTRDYWDTDALMRDAIEAGQSRAAVAGITLRFEPSGFGSLYVDRRRIVRAFATLIANALDAAARGSDVVMRAREGEGCTRFEVCVSRASASPPVAFNRYEAQTHAPTDGATSEVTLFTCTRLVAAHNGRLGLDRGPADAQTFWLTLSTKPACLT